MSKAVQSGAGSVMPRSAVRFRTTQPISDGSMRLLLENVRSFTGRHEVDIRPLTLVVGENSSGKTSLLAMLARACDYSFISMRPNFSVSPFDLGNYDSIGTLLGPRHVPSFSVGLVTSATPSIRIRAVYKNRGGQPELAHLEIITGDDYFDLSVEGQEVHVSANIQATLSPQSSSPFQFSTRKPRTDESFGFPGMPLGFPIGVMSELMGKESAGREAAFEVFNWLAQVSSRLAGEVLTTQAIAPIRTHPRRTYDELSDTFRPTGDHVPFVMAQAWQKGNEAQRDRLRDALRAFGRESGLLDDITIRRLGRRPGDPFQIMVSIAGSRTNLADVGYGVSQSLPIIVQSVLMPQNRQLLLQQPEVHLHPRAQAALGSLLADFVAVGSKSFVVETHSDFLVNRIRLEVARKKLKADTVSILFLRKTRGRSRVYPMNLDDQGNIHGAPKLFRQFFIDEEMRLLSRVGAPDVRNS